MACDHSKAHRSDVVIVSMSDEDDGPTTHWVAELRVWCDECGAPFLFLGLPAGALLKQPSGSLDGLVIMAPIVPIELQAAPVELH